MLYIYPQSLDFHNIKGRNIGIKIQFMAGEDPVNDALQVAIWILWLFVVNDTYQVIYGRSSGPKFVKEMWATVLYHNK